MNPAPGPGPPESADLLIIGGGINGAGIACDAAGRGLKVVLCEQGDLAGATSSASSKLIHGGLRYLEHYQFRLVREALAEREVLLAKAPHLIRPMDFVLPHVMAERPAWMIRIGLWLYDHLASRGRLAGSRRVDLATAAEGEVLKPGLATGFVYSDAFVDDSRLVVANAQAAADAGAVVLTRTECTAARRDGSAWQAVLQDRINGAEHSLRARALVNAAGPWAGRVAERIAGIVPGHRPRLVKGSHLVVPRLHDGDQAYVLQNEDGRIVFVVPFEDRFSLIGTTEVPYSGNPGEAGADDSEIDYLCRSVSRYFRDPVSPDDVVWRYSGVRPLWDDEAADPSAVTRDYALELDGGDATPAVLTVFGGKLTIYRRLAEQVLELLAPHLPAMTPPWTTSEPLPGGAVEGGDMARFRRRVGALYPWLPDDLAGRYVRLYGERVHLVLENCREPDDLGIAFGAGLHGREAAYLIENEWARSAEDILWRRTKLGLLMTPEGAEKLESWVRDRLSGG